MVKGGAPREDLYCRLRVVPIQVPALRERPEDIPLLANHFLAYYWSRHRGANTPGPTLTKAAVWALRAHRWPGNVRELQNVIEPSCFWSREPRCSRKTSHSWAPSRARAKFAEAAIEQANTDESYYVARERLLAKFDRHYLIRVVLQAGGNLSTAARIARVDRTTFYRLMLQRNSPATTPVSATNPLACTVADADL